MTKRNHRIAQETIARWRETIMKTGRGDVDAAKKLITKFAPSSRIYVVDSPLQFYIAQAVIRRRITKEYARITACPAFNISPDFIKDLRGHGGTCEFLSSRVWSRNAVHNLADRTLKSYMSLVCDNKPIKAGTLDEERRVVHGVSRWRVLSGRTDLQNLLLYQTCGLHNLYHEFLRNGEPFATGVSSALRMVAECLGFDTRMIQNSCLSISDAISNNGMDIVTGNYDFQLHGFDATQSEILAKTLNCKDPAVNFFHEIFHLVPAIMRFKDAFLILGEKPKISVNADGQLHREDGAAVAYADGSGFWFLDGHILREKGPKIVLAPDHLNGKEVDELRNEEERRLAIDRMGWEKYLTEIGATVMDTRENWVDNTTEVLFKTPNNGREQPLRALLACRSTGRRYFLAVPRTNETRRWWGYKSKPKNISSCEDVQKWMSNGANTEYLPYAKHEIRVVGAS